MWMNDQVVASARDLEPAAEFPMKLLPNLADGVARKRGVRLTIVICLLRCKVDKLPVARQKEHALVRPRQRSAFDRISEDYEKLAGYYVTKQKVLVEHPETLARAKMVRTDRHKYVHRVEGDCELYDLEDDPDELNNLAGDSAHAGVVAQMKERLLRFMLETETDRPEIAKLWA